MVFWIGGTIITFGVTIFFYVKKWVSGCCTSFFVPCSIVIFISVGLLCASHIISACSLREAVKQVETVKINVLFGNQAIYVSRYSNSGKMKYHYIVQTEKGLAFDEVCAKDSYINFTNEAPRIEIYETRPKNSIINFLFGWTDYEYHFYVPEGSVIDSFEINLK